MVHGDLDRIDGSLGPELSANEGRALLARAGVQVLAAGHTHRPLVLPLPGGLVANSGSVGRPYYDHPEAQYLVLDLKPAPSAEIRTLAYDLAAVGEAYRSRGLPETLYQTLAAGRSFTQRDEQVLSRWARENRPPWLDALTVI
jgi:hypothetical protein